MGIFDKHRNIATICLVSRDGWCLIVRRPDSDPSSFGKEYPLEMPCGGSEKWELPKTTAIREAKEEVGVDLERSDLIPVSRGIDFTFESTDWRVTTVSSKMVHRYAVYFRDLDHEELCDRVKLSSEHVEKLMIPITEESLAGCSGLPEVFHRFALVSWRRICKQYGVS